MFGKNDFIGIIDVLEQQHEYDASYVVLIEQIIKANDVPTYDNTKLVNHFFSLLQRQFPPDEQGTCEIERYCYELNFGWVDGNRAITPADLWDALEKKYGPQEEKEPESKE
jgi:hypothetical protein